MRTLRVCLSALVLALPLAAHAAPKAGTVPLAAGWMVQSSAKVPETGDVLSTPKYQPKDWYTTTAPSTVFAALVEHKVYADPFEGMNLRKTPGVTYPIGKNFAKFPMQADSPWAVPWWYRTQFTLPATAKGKTSWLHFAGINYRANIWVNGKQVAKAEDVAGALRTYDLDVTAVVQPGPNVVAVQIFAPKETDLAITFVDWNPAPPDKSMGLWRDVYLTTSGPVAIRYPTVISKVDSPANDKAHLTVTALLKNATDKPVTGKLKGRIEAIAFEQELTLGPGEQKDVVFTPEQFAQLNLNKPKLWYPAQMGTPNLYPLGLRFEVGGKLSDETSTRFGVREVKNELDAAKHRLFSINGQKLLVRGAGWSSDMLLRQDFPRMEDQLRYVKDMGLNTVRLEGKLEPDEFFEMTDRMGLLVMAGWCCCDHWEHWDKWNAQDRLIASQSLKDQIYRLRSHPSLLTWMNGSDFVPPPDVEKMYLKVLEEARWPNGAISSATAKESPVSGGSGVKMSGPYEYIAPRYWLEDTKNGGAHGFNSETGPGPAVPPIESLRKMFGKDHLWPIDEVWNYHAGGDVFTDIHVFAEALNKRYGKAETVEDFAQKSQLMAYEGIRAMFEAYSRNKYTSTGVIQWMLNNAWPGIIWHLYDFYLRPGGGYFGAKKALEDLHPLYSYTDHSVWVVNSRYADVKDLKLTAAIYDLDGTEKHKAEAAVVAPADSSTNVLRLPEQPGISPTYFVRLTLTDKQGAVVGSNLYWLSTKAETLDYPKTQWYVTPTTTFADFTALSRLPKVTLKVKSRTAKKGADATTTVTLENPSKSLAFFVRLKVNKGAGGEEILPVLWQDNYVSLMPGEKRDIAATYRSKDLGGAAPAVEVSGWNVAP